MSGTCRCSTGLLEQLAGDDLALDLRRAFVDAGRAHLTVEVLEHMALLQTARAVHLDRDVDSSLSGLGGEELGHCRRLAHGPDARVVLGRRLADEEPRRLNLSRNV